MPQPMPTQKPGKSEQEVVTPWKLIDAVEKRFGRLDFDLAASAENHRVRQVSPQPQCSVGKPYFDLSDDSLKQDWTELSGNLWLNPPFGRTAEAKRGLEHWARKCCESVPSSPGSGLNRRIFLLVPASTSASWFADFVWDRSWVQLLQGRVRFDGHDNDYPKDILLAVYGGLRTHETNGERVELWNWRAE